MTHSTPNLAGPERCRLAGRTVRLARHLAGCSQAGFAARLRMTVNLVENAEQGRRAVPPWLLEAVARAAGMSPTALIVLKDAADGAVQLDAEQRAWLADQLLTAALDGLRSGEGPR